MVATSTLAIMAAAGGIGTALGLRKRAARKAAEAAAADPSTVLGPAPRAPMGALEAESRARAEQLAAGDLAMRQARRPFGAPTAPAAVGAQALIRRRPAAHLVGAAA